VSPLPPRRPILGPGAPGDPGDPNIGRPPRPFPPFPPRPIPWTPFGPGDTAAPDPAKVVAESEGIRAALEKAQLELTGMRHGPGPDGTPPVVRDLTRAEGLWPWVLVRQFAGDTGTRPLLAGQITDINQRSQRSPDILVVNSLAHPVGVVPISEVGRAGMDALVARAAAVTELFTSHPYDLWVHVWNLGRARATGVRIRAFLGLNGRYIGGRQVDLADREHDGSHRVVKVATFVPTFPPDDAFPLINVVAECLSDVASGDRSPGMDRHVAHRGIYISPG
jgi:hypothetical protein